VFRSLQRAVRLPALALLMLAPIACDREASESQSAMVSSIGYGATAPAQDFAGKGMAGSPPQVAPDMTDAAARPLPQEQVQPGQMLIRTGFVAVRVDSLELAMAAVRQLATSLGGSVGNVSMNSGEFQVRSATLELRIPTEKFDEAMGGMTPLGRVEQSSTSVQDVGEEFVDLNARMANSKRLEARLVDLLATRTGRLEDVLAVERELARVRQEIERSQGRLRYLGARVSMSTLNVTVSEREPVVGANPGRNVIVEAFVDAWRNFVGFVAWFIESLGVIIPVVFAVWLALRLLRGRRRRVAD
jgi:hypothetical protein